MCPTWSLMDWFLRKCRIPSSLRLEPGWEWLCNHPHFPLTNLSFRISPRYSVDLRTTCWLIHWFNEAWLGSTPFTLAWSLRWCLLPMDFVFLARIWNENHGPRGIWSFQLSELDTWESCIFGDSIPCFCEITLSTSKFFKIISSLSYPVALHVLWFYTWKPRTYNQAWGTLGKP